MMSVHGEGGQVVPAPLLHIPYPLSLEQGQPQPSRRRRRRAARGAPTGRGAVEEGVNRVRCHRRHGRCSLEFGRDAASPLLDGVVGRVDDEQANGHAEERTGGKDVVAVLEGGDDAEAVGLRPRR